MNTKLNSDNYLKELKELNAKYGINDETDIENKEYFQDLLTEYLNNTEIDEEEIPFNKDKALILLIHIMALKDSLYEGEDDDSEYNEAMSFILGNTV